MNITDDFFEIIRQLNANCIAAIEERDRLREIVGRSPKDAEGNPCLPGDIRYHPDEIPKGYVHYQDWEDLDDEDVEFCYQWDGEYVKKNSPSGLPWSYRPICECYATKEAAEAEKKRREEMKLEMCDEHDFSQGVRGKHVKDTKNEK